MLPANYETASTPVLRKGRKGDYPKIVAVGAFGAKTHHRVSCLLLLFATRSPAEPGAIIGAGVHRKSKPPGHISAWNPDNQRTLDPHRTSTVPPPTNTDTRLLQLLDPIWGEDKRTHQVELGLGRDGHAGLWDIHSELAHRRHAAKGQGECRAR